MPTFSLSLSLSLCVCQSALFPLHLPAGPQLIPPLKPPLIQQFPPRGCSLLVPLPASSDGCRLGSNQHQCPTIFQHRSITADCLCPPPRPPHHHEHRTRGEDRLGGQPLIRVVFSGLFKRCWRRSATSRLAENHARAAASSPRRHLETTRARDRCERGHAPWTTLGSSGGGGCR